jgi:hypothetical protein
MTCNFVACQTCGRTHSDKVAHVCTYTQAELDAAVAAERKRVTNKIYAKLRDNEVDVLILADCFEEDEK